jgi:hypothetical protein
MKMTSKYPQKERNHNGKEEFAYLRYGHGVFVIFVRGIFPAGV